MSIVFSIELCVMKNRIHLVILILVISVSCGRNTEEKPMTESVPNTSEIIRVKEYVDSVEKSVYYESTEISTIDCGCEFKYFSDSIYSPQTNSITSRSNPINDNLYRFNCTMDTLISVTPEQYSVATLFEYSMKVGAIKDKWHLLTGDGEMIYNLGRKAYFVEEDLGFNRPADEFLHTENLVLIDQNEYLRGIYNGLNKVSVNTLIEYIHVLID